MYKIFTNNQLKKKYNKLKFIIKYGQPLGNICSLYYGRYEFDIIIHGSDRLNTVTKYVLTLCT